ncbi:MAG: PQQ-binding-like beta-propeller repeat protein [Isosphaeraceae bacterium]
MSESTSEREGLLWIAKALEEAPDPQKAPSDASQGAARVLQDRIRLHLAVRAQDFCRPIATIAYPTGLVHDVVFSPDGKVLATVGEDDTIKLWDVATHRPICQPLSHDGKAIFSVAFSPPDGRILATGGEDGKVRLWESATGKPVGKPMVLGKPILEVAYSFDGRFLVSSGAQAGPGGREQASPTDGEARLWDVASGKPIGQPLRHDGELVAVFFGPRSHTLATAGLNSGRVQLWDAATGRPIGQPLDHDGKSIQAIAFAPDGRILATTGEDGTARLWDAMSGRSLGKILRHDGKALNQAAFSPDGKTLATAGEDGTAWLWDVATGQAVGRPLRHDGNPIGIVFGPNIIATTGRDASVRLWDPATGEPIGQPLRHDGAPIYQVLFSPDGRILATTGGDRTARLWEMPTGRPIGAPLEHDGALVVKLAFRPDSLLLASAGGDSSARLWDAVRGRQVDRPLRHAGLPKQRRESNEFAYSADGRILAILDDEGKVHLSDGQTGRPMGKRLRHDGGRIEQFSFSRDGKSLATAGPQNKSGGSSVCLWDVNTWRLRGQPMLFPASEPVRQIAFTPHRALLATIQGLSIPPDKETVLVRFWDIATGESRGTPLRLADVSIEGIERIVFSPNGRSLATIDRSPGVATLWYLAMGKLIGQKIQHKDSDIKDVEFSPDGRVLASAGDDGIVRLWDAVSGNPHGRTFSPDKSRLPDGILPGIVSFWDVVFSPDGRLLAAAGEDGSYLWDVETGERRAIHTVAQGKDVTSIMLRQRHDRIVFRPDGRVIATIGDGIVRLWDVETARMIANPIDIGNHRIDRVAFHPSGKHLATGALDGTVRLWDLPRRQELRQLSYSADGDEYGGIQKNNFVISPNGRMLATISADGSARLRDAASGQTISPELRHDGKPINSLGFGEFGAPLITLTSNSGEPDQCGTVRLWDPSTGQPLLTRHARELDAAKKFAISSDGRFLALVSKDNTVQCWELKTDRPFGIETRCGVKTIADLVLSPDGKALATVAADGEARLWDMATGLSRGGELVHEGTPVTRSIFGPDGRCLATSSKDGMVRLWDVQTGAPIGQPILGEGAPSRFFIEPSDRGTEVLFGPGGRVVATQNRGRVSLWDAATGKLRGEAALQDGYSWSSMCFSPDESILAVASGSSVALYSTATGQSIGDLNHIGVTIHSLEFGSPKFGSGMILATVCDDGTARLWDVEVQAPIGQPLQHGESHDGISGVHFLPDGRSLLISSDSRVWLWRNVLPADSGESRDILASQCRKLVAARLGERGVLIDDDPPAISDPKEDAAEDPWFFDLAADKDDRAWDAITARKALEQGDYFGALWHLDRLIASDPKDLEVQELRARVFRKRAQKHYERGAFSDEVDDLSLFLKLKPNDYEMWVYHQFAVLNLGRISRFKEGCVTLVDRFEMKSDPNQKNMIAWICALVPDALPDLSRAVRLSEDAVAAVPNPMWRKTLGALLYRVGRYEDAARQLHEAVSTKGGLEKASMEDLLFLAMVNKKLGKGAEAEDCLARAEEKLAREEKMVVRVPKVIYDDTTYNMLQREEERQWPMLQREAVSLIRGVAASKQVGSSIPR